MELLYKERKEETIDLSRKKDKGIWERIRNDWSPEGRGTGTRSLFWGTNESKVISLGNKLMLISLRWKKTRPSEHAELSKQQVTLSWPATSTSQCCELPLDNLPSLNVWSPWCEPQWKVRVVITHKSGVRAGCDQKSRWAAVAKFYGTGTFTYTNEVIFH